MESEARDARADLLSFLESGRHVLQEAPRQFQRTFGPEDYFWLGVCLAAIVLADVQQRPNVTGRLEALADAIGRQGPQPELVESLTNELAILDSLGLLWPLYRRDQGQWVRDPDVPLAPGFAAEDAYWLGVAHVAAALLYQAGRGAEVGEFGQVIGDIVTGGIRPDDVQAILAVIGSIQGEE